MHDPHDHAGAPAHHHHAFESVEAADFAEAEGEVLAELTARAADLVAAQLPGGTDEVRRAMDLGCGPGVGTGLLAERFPAAQLLAVDGSATMLERAATRAAQLGFADRLRTRQAQLPADLPTLERAEVIWASMVLHHVGDEVGALRRIADLLEPAGLLALAEQAGAVTVLPADAHERHPGLGERIDAAWGQWFATMRGTLPDAAPSEGYGEMLESAGFDVLVDEVLTLTLDPTRDPRARRFARRHAVHAPDQLGPYLNESDRAVLRELADALADDGSDDWPLDHAPLRVARHLFVARHTTTTATTWRTP